MWWANYLVGFGKPNFTYTRVGATPIWANFCHPKFDPFRNKSNLLFMLYSFDRVQSPDHFGMSIFEIVKKMTELWPKYICPYMGIGATLGFFGL